MMRLFDTIKGRLVIVLVAFLSLSHLLGLWLYVQKSDEATTLLHDALLAEQMALMARLAGRLPASDRGAIIGALSGPIVRIEQTRSAVLAAALPEGSRGHAFEHFLAVFLDRSAHEGIRLAATSAAYADDAQNLLSKIQGSKYSHADHLPAAPLADIKPIGGVVAEIALSDGSWLRFDAPLLTVTPFSFPKLGAPLASMLASILLVAAWVLNRWTRSLSQFAAAADRLGIDIHAPALPERGPLEVRTAARTFNLMQERIRRLLEDRTAFAAAIAHDLGTPITRLHLRAHEIDDEGVRAQFLSDLEQMRRMITATLGFARSDFSAEAPQTFDVTSTVQSVCDDLADLGHDVTVDAPGPFTVHSKPVALRRAVSNLVENAVKYGGRARVELLDIGHGVAVHVDDDGAGIPDHLREEAFRPFRRLGPQDAAIEGSGLGLTVARAIMRALGGDVVLSNHKTGGLRASIVLPKRREWVAERPQPEHIAPDDAAAKPAELVAG